MKTKLEELPDPDLFFFIQGGDESAYEVMFRRYYKRLCAFSFSMLKDDAVAEELAVDVMLRLWKKRSDLSFDESLKPFLFRCIKWAVLNHLKKKKILTEPIDDMEESFGRSSLDADSRVLARELEEKYQLILSELPEQRRLIFHMSRIEHMSNQEIADQLNLSVQTVKNQISASLTHFRKHFNQQDTAMFLCLVGLVIDKLNN